MKRKLLLTVSGFVSLFVVFFLVQQSFQSVLIPPVTTLLATPSNTPLNHKTPLISAANKNTSASIPASISIPQQVQSASLTNNEAQILDDFQTWLIRKKNNLSHDSWEQQGQKLAQQRQAIMQTLIQNQPKQALAQSLTLQQYAELPKSIKNFVEQPFSKKVKLVVLPNETRNKNAKGVHQNNHQSYIEFDQQRLRVYRYGQRNTLLSKQNLAAQGIILGKEAVISDQALMPIAPADYAYMQQRFADPNQNTNASQTDFYTGRAIQGDAVFALAGGKLLAFASSKNIHKLNTQLARLEQINHPQSTANILAKQLSNTVQKHRLPLSQRLAKLLAKPSDWTTTVKKVLLIRVITADASGAAISQAELQTALTNSSDLIKKISHDKTALEVNVSSQPFTLSKNTASYSSDTGASDLLTEAKTLFSAANSSVDLNSYDIVGVHIGGEKLSVDWAGLASVGGGDYWLNNTVDLTTVTHEFGHIYGLSHANFWETNNASVVGAGSDEAYGDSFDIMGKGSAPEAYFHPQSLAKLTWLESTTDWTDISTSGTYRLTRFDHETATGVRGLRIARNGGTVEGYYWLGYRQNYDNNPFLENGAYLIWEQAGEEKSWLIDTTPASFADANEDKQDAGIVVGQSYSDTAANIHITTLAKGGTAPNEWLDIQVNLGDFPSNNAPTVSLAVPSPLTARTALTFIATASDSDGDTLAYQWDFGDGVIHPSSASINQTWTVGGSYTVKVTVSDMKGKTATAQQTITVADPLTQWTDRTSGTTENIVDIAANSSLAVAISNFEVLGSSDGMTWTELDERKKSGTGLGFNTYLRSIIYDGSQWIAVGQDYDGTDWQGVVYTSPDAATWTERYKAGKQLQSIASSGSILMAVGDAGNAIRSTDAGLTWSPVSTGISTTLRDISYGNGQFIAVGNAYITDEVAAILTSSDGQIWTNQTAVAGTATSSGFHIINYLNDKFIAVGHNATLSYLDNNTGIAFLSSRSDREVGSALIYGANLYFVAGINQDDANKDIDLVSLDGKSWTIVSNTPAVEDRNAGVFFKDTFITVGNNGAIRQSDVIAATTTVIADADNDTIADSNDNCPNTANTDQTDLDGDGTGDVCDDDRDGDGVDNTTDIFPDNAAESVDGDGDNIGDNADNCPTTANNDQTDSDQNGTGDACENTTTTPTIQRPFPQHASYAPNTIRPTHFTQSEQDQHVKTFYDYWKQNYLVSAGTNSSSQALYRVAFGKSGTNAAITVSEGQGYGMEILALMAGYDTDAQTIFNGLWRFVRQYPSGIDNRLMSWKIQNGSIADGNDSAFDGDVDIAYGLLLADAQWGSAGNINYKAEAITVIQAILASTIGASSRLPMLGDWVDDNGAKYNQYTPRSSDFMPAHFRSFGRVTSDSTWDTVVANSQAAIDAVQAMSSNTTGLLPDFIVDCNPVTSCKPSNGQFLESPNDEFYYYNAGRDPLRIGLDALLNANSRSHTQVKNMLDWLVTATGGQASNIKSGYQLDGTVIGNYSSSFFTAPFGVAAMLDPNQQNFLNDIYSQVYNKYEDYYEDSVNLLSLLVMTGNYWEAVPAVIDPNDTDGDGVANTDDNCPDIANTNQLNQDNDTQGDVCDSDRDGDGVANDQDAFPDNAVENVDSDSDGIGDKGDNCPSISNADQLDDDIDGVGNVCDSQANIIELSGSLTTYFNSINYGVASENTWLKPDATKISQFKQVFSDFLAGNYNTAHSNALPLGYELVKYTNTDSSATDIHYILRERADVTFTGGGTYVLYPTGKNAVLQTPHPKFDSNTATQGIETYLTVRPRLLMLAGTRRDNSTAKSACTDGNYFDSDVAHQTQSLFYAAHQVASDADNATVFIQFHGFGSTTLGTLQTQCASSNPKLINLSEGVNYITPETENSLLHILRKKVDAGGLIETCVYGNDTNSLGGTYNVEGRYSNYSSESCNNNASVSSKRFIHLEQSSEVRSTHRADMADYIDQALTEYTSINTATDLTSIKPYFSKTSGTYYIDGVDNLIIDDIAKATTSIKMAMYDLTNKNITQALIDAHNRGILVEVITDDNNITDEKYGELINAGITVKDDQNPNALMHNKILILDEKVVWIGSANYTVYAFYRNNENLLRIDSAALATVYLAKFTALFSQSPSPVNPYLSDNLEIYFSPDHDFENRLISLINTAKTSINFLAFAFTNQEISDALIAAKARGVLIQGVFDEGQNSFQASSKYQNLFDNGIAVKLDANLEKLHNKIFIIDDKITVTGSYNFTSAANDSNDENSIIIFDPTLSQAYLTEFNIIYNAVVPITDTDNDGISDATDPDDDNDIIPDTWEIDNGLDPLDASDALTDRNNDGINNLNEYFQSLSTIWRPKPNTSWQWQLTGTLDTSLAVAMYNIDLFDTPQATIDLLHSQGKKVICYFSAGSYENWREDKDQFPASVLGSVLDGWPDEQWLDISKIDILAPIMQARLDLAVSKQCDGVEPDNVDGYQNDKLLSLTAADQLAYNQWLSIQAHQRGLSIGLKNDLDQIPELLQYFDFALNEQCYEYTECDALNPFISAGKAVFGVEYTGNITDFCPKATAAQFSWLLKNLDLDASRTACENTSLPDSDADGLIDVNDNCINIANPNQADLDGDGIGNVCDSDRDGDGIENDQDTFPDDATVDSDGDGFGDTVDVFPNNPTEWLDSDNDGVGDNADQFPNDNTKSLDSDFDGIDDSSDNCPLNPNPQQADSDNDNIGDICDIAQDDTAVTAVLNAITTIEDDWGTGFCADVVVLNTTANKVDWTTSFTPEGTIKGVWSALVSAPNSEGVVTAEGMNYNNTLEANESAYFGYCANRVLDTSQVHNFSVSFPNELDDEWDTGYCTEITVKNDQDHVVDWQATLVLPSDKQGTITSFWNANYSLSDNTITADGVNWNNWLLPNQTTEFGFCLNRNNASGSDTTPPEVTAPDALTGDNALKSKQFLTAFSLSRLGTASANDDTEGSVTARIASVDGEDIVLKNGKILLRPGRHLIVWKAEDSAGNRGVSQQYVDVLPRANFVVNQSSSEGQTLTIEAWLNGDAPSYPVEIPFNLHSSSTVDSADYQLSDTKIVIEQLQAGDAQENPHGAVTINLLDEGDNTETTEKIVFKMDKDNMKNAVAGKKRQHKITILNENKPPKVRLRITQGDSKGRKVMQGSGNVSINANAKDPNGDTLSYAWTATGLSDIPETPDDNPATFVFDPDQISIGRYKVSVAVSDGINTISKKKRLKVSAAVNISSTADSDNDGILDINEADDADGNGIPDYLEAPHDQHELPSDGDSMLAGEPGTELGLGSIAFDSEDGDCAVSEAEIKAYLESAGLPAFQEDSNYEAEKIFDYVISALEEPGASSQIVLSLPSALTANSTIRKYNITTATWSDFSVDANNVLESLISSDGNCSDDEDTVWTTGLVVGGTCLRLTIEDGGPNDADGIANGEIDDPVAITTEKSTTTTTTTTSTGGGSTGGTSTVTTVESNHINYFKLTIDQALAVDASVDYTTHDGSATAGQDYIATSGTATIPAGQTQVLIPIEILADQQNEADETFNLVLSNPVGGIFPVGTTEMVVTHTIIDNKTVNVSFKEGNSNHINYFKLELNKALSVNASVNYTTRNGTAIAGQDYIATTGTVTLNTGETRLLIPVEIIADTLAEADETFSLVITNPTGGVFPASTSEIISTHTIVNDD